MKPRYRFVGRSKRPLGDVYVFETTNPEIPLFDGEFQPRTAVWQYVDRFWKAS